MNLLDATATLIDFAKTNAHESDRVVQRAIRRMEQRHAVLQLRAARNRKRTRSKAFWNAMALFDGYSTALNGAGKLQAAFSCYDCEHRFFFGDFIKHAKWDGRGIVTLLICPNCQADMTEFQVGMGGRK
jgi:hypothetical protein